MARRATGRFLSRYSRHSALIIAIALIAAGLFALQRTWWLVSAFTLMALIYTSMLVKYRRTAVRMARRLGSPEVTVIVDESGMTFRMPAYQSIAAWTPQRELWQFDDVWIFMPFGVSQSYSAVPASAMTPEFREIVLTNMRAQGATVR